jgi:hypothetical protein
MSLFTKLKLTWHSSLGVVRIETYARLLPRITSEVSVRTSTMFFAQAGQDGLVQHSFDVSEARTP